MKSTSPVIAQAVSEAATEKGLSPEKAGELLAAPLFQLMQGAEEIRRKYFKNFVSLCSIVNARSGLCGEDCIFCAQSSRHATGVQTYPLKKTEELLARASRAAVNGVHHFGIVTSGRAVAPGEIDAVCRAISLLKGQDRPTPCASLGELNRETAAMLRNAGLTRYHHNLETCERFFPSICTTHTWHDRLETVSAAKSAGLEVCSGGIFGLGESWQDRIDLAFTLKELDVDSVPLNFLAPVKGTPLGGKELLPAEEALRIIAVFRFILPDKCIRVAGGRQTVLGDKQRLIFSAGASGMMIGDYLTTKGSPVEDDLDMLADLGLRLR